MTILYDNFIVQMTQISNMKVIGFFLPSATEFNRQFDDFLSIKPITFIFEI